MPFNHDYIELNNIIAATRLGVTAEEQSKIQDIVINLKLYKELKLPGISDNVEDTINYANVINFIYQELTKTKFHLIESLAEHLINQVANLFSPNAIEIDISKINPPLDYYPDSKISIHIYREFTKG